VRGKRRAKWVFSFFSPAGSNSQIVYGSMGIPVFVILFLAFFFVYIHADVLGDYDQRNLRVCKTRKKMIEVVKLEN